MHYQIMVHVGGLESMNEAKQLLEETAESNSCNIQEKLLNIINVILTLVNPIEVNRKIFCS